MKKILKTIFIIIFLIGIIYAGYFVYNEYFSTSHTTYNVVKGDYNEIVNVKGTIDTINSAEVYSKSANLIDKILVKEGDEVKEGEILAYLDDNKIHQYESAKVNYDEAKRSFEIAKKLYATGDISKDNYMKAKAVLDLAKVSLDSIEVEDDLVVKAPIDGIVIKINAKIGMVAGGFIPVKLFQIEDLNKLQIKVDIKEKDLHKIKVGQTASITSDAMGERVFYGKVSYISSMGEASGNNNTKKVIEAIIDIDEKEKNITAGVSVKADIIVKKYNDVLIIPIDCLVEEIDESYIYIKSGKGKKKVIISPLVVADDEFIIKNDNTISAEDIIFGVE